MIASSTGIETASWARKSTAFASWRSSSMPAISKLRTPTWFVASPSRTPRRGSECSVKNSFSAAASAGTSRTSPRTTIPGGSGCRASWRRCAEPLLHDPRGRELRRADLDADELARPRALRRGAPAACPSGGRLLRSAAFAVLRTRSESLISFLKSITGYTFVSERTRSRVAGGRGRARGTRSRRARAGRAAAPGGSCARRRPRR